MDLRIMPIDNKKRGIFYPDGKMIPYKMPNDYRKQSSANSCGNCGMFSNRRFYCGVHNSMEVRDTWTCNSWRKRRIKRDD